MKRNYLASLVGLFLAFAFGAAAAETAGPSADYKIDPEYTSTSPDGATTIEQYAKTDADGNDTWQFWARHGDKPTLLKPEQQDYSAGFRFTNDSRWLMRTQKTGSGEANLYLYKLGPDGFVAATAKPLSDLAWAYFYSRPDSRKIMKPDFTSMRTSSKEPTKTIAERASIGRTIATSSSLCRATCRPTNGMVRSGRLAAGAAGMICKRARSTCRRNSTNTMRRPLVPTLNNGIP
jgi:hypothetical protein